MDRLAFALELAIRATTVCVVVALPLCLLAQLFR